MSKSKKYKIKQKDFRKLEKLAERIYNTVTVICENTCGERFVFMKEFLIDPRKPDDIYSDLILERKE